MCKTKVLFVISHGKRSPVQIFQTQSIYIITAYCISSRHSVVPNEQRYVFTLNSALSPEMQNYFLRKQ